MWFNLGEEKPFLAMAPQLTTRTVVRMTGRMGDSGIFKVGMGGCLAKVGATPSPTNRGEAHGSCGQPCSACVLKKILNVGSWLQFPEICLSVGSRALHTNR